MKTKWSAFCQAEHNPAHTIAFTTNIKASRSKFDRRKSVQIFLKKSKKSSKKLLHFSIIYGIIANVVQYRYAVLQNKAAKSSFLGGVKGWQSAVSVVRALFSVRTFLTLTVKPTEPGNPIFAKSNWKAAKQSTFVPVACAP